MKFYLSLAVAFIFILGCDKDDKGPTAPVEVEEREFELTDSVNITMVWIPAGSFMMGAQEDEQDARDDEYPRHRVTLDYGFWMGKYEVNQAQYEAVTGENPAHDYGVGDNHPVYNVSWDDIHGDFLDRINDDYRLPSEAEWEYACRAGTDTRFYWGDDPDNEDIDEYAVYDDNDPNGTADVGTKRPNAWGLYDMSGNVWEWCEDWYHSDYTNAPSDGTAWLSPGGSFRVFRGGSFFDYVQDCRSAKRYFLIPRPRSRNLGFRLVLDR